MSFRLSAALGLLATMACSGPMTLIYKPEGLVTEIYKSQPVPLEMRVYPFDGEATGAVIFIHGGGWAVGGADVPLYQDWEKPLRSAGLRAFSIEHRLAPAARGIDIIQDCMAAVRYVNDNAARFRIPKGRIHLVGFSSGGHLAVMSGILFSRTSGREIVRSVTAYYAPLDLASLYMGGSPEIRRILEDYLPEYTPEPNNDLASWSRFYTRVIHEVSPIENLHPRVPDFFLVHGEEDHLIPVSQTQAFAAKLGEIRAGAAVLDIAKNADHNFNVSRGKWAREIEKRVVQFIAAHNT